MSNFLTGDFDAVVQLSRGTVNRLLATTHQNRQGYSKKCLYHLRSWRVGLGAMNRLLQVPTIEIES